MTNKGAVISRLIAVAGGKGGTGRTTLALNLAAALSRQGYRALVADGDPLQSACRWASSFEQAPVTVASCLPQHDEEGHSPLADVQRLAREADADIVIADLPARSDYHHTALLHAADLVLIPANTSALDLPALTRVIRQLQEVQEEGTTVNGLIIPVLDATTAAPPEALSRLGLPLGPALTRQMDFSSGLAPTGSAGEKQVTAMAKELLARLQPAMPTTPTLANA